MRRQLRKSQSHVAFVSAGLLTPKKYDSQFARKHRFLNYGLLALATIVRNSGHDARVFHGDFTVPELLAERLVAEGQLPSTGPLFLSLPSHLSLPWAARFLGEVRDLTPHQKIVVGGRWVVSDGPDAIRRAIGPVDLVVYGLADDRIEALLSPDQWQRIPGTDINPRRVRSTAVDYVDLRSDLIDGFLTYQPSIELARGCGRPCLFCEDSREPLTPTRNPHSLVRSIERTVEAYGTDAITPYFEASHFCPSLAWSQRAAALIAASPARLKWRCSTRADTLTPALIKTLGSAGMKVIDIGLESASATQLIAMRKTRHPDAYLARASDALKACSDQGLWPKLNILLYAGETPDTLRDTVEWLHQHSAYIKGISANTVTAYGTSQRTRQLCADLARLGARPVVREIVGTPGAIRFHLSPKLDFDASQELIRVLAQTFMSQRDYYDLKAFSYFDRRYTYSEFCEDIREISQERLPFLKSRLERDPDLTSVHP